MLRMPVGLNQHLIHSINKLNLGMMRCMIKTEYFDAPPMEFDRNIAHISSASDNLAASRPDLDESPEPKKVIKSDKKQSYKGWQPLSDIIFSKNLHKMNYLKNWHEIYQKIITRTISQCYF